jgi:hypothetical protein
VVVAVVMMMVVAVELEDIKNPMEQLPDLTLYLL